MNHKRTDYETSEEWEDVVPIPQNEGGFNPLAAIAYTEEYSQATSYLRAVMANNEMSDRVLSLTEHVIGLNPAHYTVWLYRAATIKELSKNPLEELLWLNNTSLKHLKNYQIWQHRQVIMSMVPDLPKNEMPFLARMLAKDAKNYHPWSYRQWLVRHFSLWPTPDISSPELEFTDNLLTSDVRNNSAWNHRFFILFGRDTVDEPFIFDPESVPASVWNREIEFTKGKISEAPQNASAWNYLSGVLKKRERHCRSIKEFALEYADLDKIDQVRSSHALDVLAEIWAFEKESDKATRALQLLAERFDPLRKNYWTWRIDTMSNGHA